MALLANNAVKLAAFRRGDRAVLEEVYHAYVDEIAMLVRRGFWYSREKVFSVQGVSDEQQQFDLIQETFARGFSDAARQRYDGRTPYRLYLLRIAKNLMIDNLRKSGREVIPHSSNGTGDMDDILDKHLTCLPEDPALASHRQRQQEAVAAYVARLNPSEMQFYQKRYVLGFSQQKTAEALGMSRRHIRTLEQRICKALKKYLKKSGLWP